VEEKTALSPQSKEAILEEEINCCFFRLIEKGALTIEQLNFLLSIDADEVSIYLPIVADQILQQIREGNLKRWDFDLWDKRWRNEDGRKASGFIHNIRPKQKTISRKRGVFARIVKAYRDKCKLIVCEFRTKAYTSESLEELQEVLEEAINTGLIICKDDKIMHNHSWVDSKRFFESYMQRFFELKSVETPLGRLSKK